MNTTFGALTQPFIKTTLSKNNIDKTEKSQTSPETVDTSNNNKNDTVDINQGLFQ